EALPSLAELAGQLPEDAEGPRRDDERRCLLKVSRAHVKAVECEAALPLLRRLEGLTTGVNEEWRAEKVPWCEARITDFLTDTPMRKTAYKLYEAGKAAEEAGEPDKAEGFYRKAMGLTDEPFLRLTLAWFFVGTTGCEAGIGALELPPGTSHNLVTACGQLGPVTSMEGPELRSYLEAVVAGLDALDAGDKAAAAEHLGDAYPVGGNLEVLALHTDLLYDLRRCEAYAGSVAGAPPEARGLMTDVDARVERCESGDLPPLEGDGATGDALAVQATATTGSQTLEWGLVGGGGAALLGAAIVTILRAGTMGDLREEETTWNDPLASPDARSQAFAAIPGLQSDA
ncbi:MAG: hypothetical protein VX938_07120, partial [Myxococcota bacterium]|nr:hypothetical protein [Myxococcota bacterium]